MKVRFGLAVIVLATFSLVVPGLLAPAAVGESAAPDTTWTVMVYMADDYPITLSWQDDINEMEAAQQAPGTNIIALVDEYGDNNSFLLKVAHDPNFLDSTIVSTRIDDAGAVISGGEVNMASPSTLDAFIRFSAQTFPAERLVLDLWGHGDSWRGLCPDGTDKLTLPELSAGLSDAVSAIGRPIDIVVVDSCAEASVEMFAELRGLANIFVGSEKDVPYEGLPYVLVMNDLAANPAQGPVRFGSRIADDYVVWSTTNSDYSTTMGVFNMTKVDALLAQLDTISISGASFDQLFHDTMRATLDASEQYEESFRVDFGNFMSLMSRAELPLEIRLSALQCIFEAGGVVEHFAKFSNDYATDGILVTNASGLTIYAAGTGSADSVYADLQLARTPWSGFGILLRNSTETTPSGPGPNVTLSPSMLYDSVAYAQPPIDKATLVWPDVYDEVSAIVYRHSAGGLVQVAEFRSTGSSISFEVPGALTVAAVASVDGHAASYALLNFTLEGTSTVRISLLENGAIVEDPSGTYAIAATTSNGTEVVGGPSVATDGSVFVCRIKVPNDAEIGDTIMIEVRDASSGKLAGMASTCVPTNSTDLQINLWSTKTSPENTLVPMLFVALPGLLILVFAILVYNQGRKKH